MLEIVGMTTTESPAGFRLVLPAALEARLRAFRHLVWRTKLVEAGCAAAAGVLLGFLTVFASDRLTETPAWVRWVVFAAAVVGCAAVPLAFRRWIWRHRSFEQLARLVARRFPGFGDELLGIVEISREAAAGRSLGRSQALCAAAIGQVAARAEAVDFAAAVPPARTRLWAALAAVPLVAVLGLAGAVPAAAANAWARFLMPWRSIDRFTFTRLEPVPERIVVPHGEPATLVVSLAADSERRPRTARLAVGRQRPLVVEAAEQASGDAPSYAFALPPQLEAVPLRLAIGDARARPRLEPLLRPEITAVGAEIHLPGYLGRPEPVVQDVRGGTVTAVVGSTVALEVTASRALAQARMGDIAVAPAGTVVRTPPVPVTESTQRTITWEDVHGLAGTRPLEIAIVAKPDAAPTVALLGTPPNRSMLLDIDTLRFQVAARDDFGIRRVGIQWEAAAAGGDTAATAGDRLLAAGGHTEESLDVAATFCPQALGIAPQPILLRAFVEDYLPGRGRVSSPPLLLYVVDRAEHALVMNERLNRWRQRAGEVRDREMQLLATNRELRRLPEEKLLEAETRRSIEAQAAAEDANARRLDRLVDEGADLVREALKNPEFEAATLDQLATDIQTLADIADVRMPGVADLLRAAAEARLAKAGPPAAAAESAESAAQPPQVGEDRGAAGGGQPQEPGEPRPPLPQVVDRESSQQPSSGDPEEPGQPGQGQGRLGLPTTQAGVAPPRPPREDEPPAAAEALDEAIAGQEALLAEFAKVAEDLAAVMARLEGSTFVKRFKLASREQAALGSRIARFSAEAFGRPDRRPLEVVRAVGDAVESSGREVEKVSNLLDDMQAYFERRQLPAFRTVLEEMKDLDALGSLRQLTDDIRTEAGMSIAQAEFWSDTFDRLADELVPPPGESEGGEGQTAASLPPEVVLEAMRILEAEVNLREETRVTERSRGAIDAAAFAARATALATEQETLADRVATLAETLIDAPVGGPLFGKDVPLFGPLAVPDGQEVYRREIAVFDLVEEVMLEAGAILRAPDTGSKAIGAQTEAIELLLTSQALSGGRGGGGGAGTVGAGGATGTTRTPALALVGRGNRAKAADGEGEKEQATGTGGRVLPEEFRAGLDAYFNRFEKERP